MQVRLNKTIRTSLMAVSMLSLKTGKPTKLSLIRLKADNLLGTKGKDRYRSLLKFPAV
jgi:hypothetical protein